MLYIPVVKMWDKTDRMITQLLSTGSTLYYVGPRQLSTKGFETKKGIS